MEKQCFKCRETKPISEFYKHPAMGDGYLGKCKTCTKRDAAERESRMRKNTRWVKSERKRCREKSALRRKLGLEKRRHVQSKFWRGRNPIKYKAHCIANNAVKSGKLKKPKHCQGCRKKHSRLEKHHPNHRQPLRVKWLCPPCHGLTRRK